MNKKLLIVELIIIFTFIFLLKCSNGLFNSSEKAKNILPLSAGNKWIWENMEENNNGRFIGKDDTCVVEKIVIENEVYYKIDDTYCYNDEDGLYVFLPETKISKLKIKYPVKKEESWSYTNNNDIVEVWSCIKKDTTIKTESGTFDCILYNISVSDWDAYRPKRFRYYCPGIGLVKSVDIDTSYTTRYDQQGNRLGTALDTTKSIKELCSYDLN